MRSAGSPGRRRNSLHEARHRDRRSGGRRWCPMSAKTRTSRTAAPAGRTRPGGAMRRAATRRRRSSRRSARGPPALACSGNERCQQVRNLARHEGRVPVVPGVFLEPVRRLRERGDQRRDLEPLDQVVEHRPAGRRSAGSRIHRARSAAGSGAATEARRHVHADVPLATERRAVHHEVLERAGSRAVGSRSVQSGRT